MEIRILDWLQGLHTPILDQMMCAVTSLGNAGIIWIVVAVVLLIVPKTRRVGMAVTAALILDMILCNGILKNLVARVRPCDVNTTVQLLIPRPEDYSFPSGHTAASFATTAALFFAGKKKKLWIPALVLSVLIAFSRLYLYVHYPTDVLGGMLVGILCGWIGAQLVNRVFKKQK